MTDNLSILQNILSHHPQVDAQDESGWTPLMIAGELVTPSKPRRMAE
jgi:ankyrin repeat protein